MTTAEELTAGPRGRRMLLAYAMEAERTRRPELNDDAFCSAVFLASYHLDPGRGTTTVMFGPGADEARQSVVTADDVARRLAEVPLPGVTAAALRSAVTAAADNARYWEEPDGEDLLAAAEPVRRELRRVAEHIARSPLSQWWTAAFAAVDQWSVNWDDDSADSPDPAAAERLHAWRDQVVDAEIRAERERPADPRANWSAEWWSTPPVRCSTRTLFDGAPAELWFVEDSMGWERATTRRVSVPAGARVYEINDAQAWAALCRDFPVEVTAQKRHDWFRATGRNGRWVVPDWARLAEDYAGVHLTVAGYLAAAGTAIEVDAETASVIAGWAPDETYWLTDAAELDTGVRTWRFDGSREQFAWVEDVRR